MVGFTRKGVTMTGSLQTKSGKYYAVINTTDTNGKRKQKWISTGIETAGNNKRKAEKRLREILQEYEKNTPVFSTDILFSDFVIEWLKSVKMSVDVVTYQGYKLIANAHIIPYFENLNIKLTNVKRETIQKYINLKSENGKLDGTGGLSPKTIKTHKLILNLVFKEAIKQELIYKNPCEFVILPKMQRREPSFYTITQINTLFDSIKNEPIYPLVYITLIYGLRRSEVLGLKWDSVDFENNKFTIKHTVVHIETVVEKDTTKTNASYRSFPLTVEAKRIFIDLKSLEEKNRCLFGKDYTENDYIFKWDNGKTYRPDYITRKFSKLLEKVGLPHIRFHDLRHSCASLLIANGYNLKDIQEWLGHSDIRVTANIYAHLDTERKKNIALSMSNTFSDI